MDEEKLLKEIERIQKLMEKINPDSDEYSELLKRLERYEDLLRKVRNEDPDYLKIKMAEEQATANRKHGFVMKLIGAAASFAGAVGLMFASHAFQNTEIFDKFDEHRIEKYEKDNS